MRLLILTPEYQAVGGGIATFYRALCPSLREEGVEIRVIEGSASYTSHDKRCRFDCGVQVETLELRRLEAWWQKFSAFESAPTLRRHLSAAWAMWEQADYGESADIVEACDWGLLSVPPAIERTRPLIVQCHASIGQIAACDPIAGEEAESALTRLIERAVFATTNVQTYSRANAEFWAAETGHDVVMTRPAWPTLSRGSGDPTARGLVVGRVQRWKGPAVLCEALQIMDSRAPNVDWLGGDAAWEARGSSTAGYLAQNYPDIWGRKVAHLGVAGADEIRRRQSVALFNLIPSTWDVFNFTTIEAMATGRPTIVSEGAGASELIEDGVNGFVFPSGDAGALAVAIDRVLAQSPSQLLEIGRAAHETVRTCCDPHTIARKRVADYRSAIEKNRLSPRSHMGGWVADICGPKEALHSREMAFLDHQPLRSIAAAVLRRAQAKAMTWITVR